jgi:hypothetical protein
MSDPLQGVTGDTWGEAVSWGEMGTWIGPYDYTWSKPETWAEMPNWLGRPQTAGLVYTDPPIDLGRRMQVYAMVDAETSDTVLLQLRTSADGVTWSAWRDTDSMIDARWVQVRASLTARVVGQAPVLEELTTVIVAKVIEKTYLDIRCVDVAPSIRYGVGDVRVTTTAFLYIDSVNVTVRLPADEPISWSLVDRDPAGPRVRFFAADGSPIDTTFDIRIRGY